ncbi:MAG: hypothetical protein KDB27_28195 [Planctomycetales bacterium]|nr:hypothetical protein [Planctomycetales bacterium]
MAQPQRQFKLGTDQISVFENDGNNGKYLSANLNGRRYQDGNDWKSTHSYSPTQLASHIALCQQTLNWMLDQAPDKPRDSD